MRKRFYRKSPSPAAQAIAGCTVSVAGICAGLFYFIPIHEGIGTLWTMFCAVIVGIYYAQLYSGLEKHFEEKRVIYKIDTNP